MIKALLQAYVLPETKTAAMEAAKDLGLSLSAWMQLVTAEAVQAHKVKRARQKAVASYSGEAPL